MVAYAAQVPAVTGRPDGSSLARRLRVARVCLHSGSLWRPPLTHPPVLTPLILGPAPQLPDCKRLHLSFVPFWVVRSSGQAKTQKLSGVRRRGCLRRASSSRHRAPRRLLTPASWVGGSLGAGVRRPPARGGVPLARRLRDPHVCPRPRSLSVPSPESARLQALASEFWPVLDGSIGRTVQNSDRKRRTHRHHL